MFLLLRSLWGIGDPSLRGPRQCAYRSKCVARPELARPKMTSKNRVRLASRGRCGHYGDPPDFKNFLRQLLDWQVRLAVEPRAIVVNMLSAATLSGSAAGPMANYVPWCYWIGVGRDR